MLDARLGSCATRAGQSVGGSAAWCERPPGTDTVTGGGTRSAGRPRRWLAATAGAAALVAAAWATVLAASDSAAPSHTVAKALLARDGTDPYDDGCRADAKQLDWQPVQWPDGRTYGSVLLMYSPACRAAWGYLQGPESRTWITHIDAHRDPDRASAPSQYSGDQTLPGSWGNVLSTGPGCVYVEAYVEQSGHLGARARTACMQPAAPDSATGGGRSVTRRS
ncbi:DUF2690 domain-containing protein [Streptomyces sp. NPDC046900]|uniref:DUF2690 domain-containing protein n=1 Tax=Streptomyces sp. NPDC046900 TaxID=3155473 RepID=UPI00340F8A5F